MGHLPSTSAAEVEERVRAAVNRGRAVRIRGDRRTSDVGTVLLALLMQPLFLGVVSTTAAVVWLVFFGLITGGRAVARLRFAAEDAPPERVLSFIRWDVWLGGGLWSAWAFLLVGAPTTQLAYLMTIVAALIASSTISLVADSRIFYGYQLLLNVPLLTAILGSGRDIENLSLAALILLYIPLMVRLHRQAHASFIDALEANARLKASEEDAARARDFLDSLIRSAPNGVVIQGRDQSILSVNPEWERMFQFQVEEVRGARLRDLIVPEDTVEVFDALVHELEARGRATLEACFVRQDGSELWGRVRGTAASGIAEGATILAMEDVTVRRSAELALIEAERQYREMVEGSTDLVWAMDREGVVTYVNSAARQMLGLAPDAVVGMHFAELVRPERLERSRELFALVLDGQAVTDQEGSLRRADGSFCEVSISARPRLVGGGVTGGVHGTARDISARVREREALEAAREEAERMTRAKTAFLASMSHEIRTPMNGVLGMLELLLGTDLDEGQRESGQLARASALALLNIVDDVLDMSKIEAGQFDLREEDFELAPLVETTVGIFALQAADRGNTLSVHVADDVPGRLHGDGGRVRQVLSNLVSNAVKFTEGGQIQTTVKALNEADDGTVTVRIAVEDSGIGVPEEELGSIFEEFAQVDPSLSRHHGGTGLGLSIAKRLVELMGGTLEAASRLGEGSRFWFDVPLRRVETAAAPAEAATAAPGASAEGRAAGGEEARPAAAAAITVASRPIRVLLAEDNPVNQMVAKAILERRGHSVHVVANGREAVAAVESGHFELVLMDVRMPEMDGLEATQAIRALTERGRLPIVALTAHALAEERQRCFDAGMDDFLSKPFKPDELFAVIEGLVDRARDGT